MTLESLYEKLNSIDNNIFQLQNSVNYYTTNLQKLSELHNIIIQNAIDSEDSVHFLLLLNEKIIQELDGVSTTKESTNTEIAKLQENINTLQTELLARNAQIQTLETDLSRIEERVTVQNTSLSGLFNNLQNNNNTLNQSINTMQNFQNKLNTLKRKHGSDLESLKQKIQRKETLQNYVNELNDESTKLKTFLTAIETLPEIETLPTIDDDERMDSSSSSSSVQQPALHSSKITKKKKTTTDARTIKDGLDFINRNKK